MGALIVFLLAGSFVVGLILGIWWLIWSLWCWVLPQVWATGPDNLIRPSYWLFVGIWVILSLIGRQLFYHPPSKD